MAQEQYFVGNWSDNASAQFAACFQVRIAQYGDESAYLQVQYYVGTRGNFGTRTTVTTNWNPSTVVLHNTGSGDVGHSPWYDVGWVAYGRGYSTSCAAWYTGYSGKYYRSDASATYYPAAPVMAPLAPTNGTAYLDESGEVIHLKWTNNSRTARPYAGIAIYTKTDGGSFVLQANLSGAVTSYDYIPEPGHTYVFQVVATNAAGSAAANTNSVTAIALPPPPPLDFTAVRSKLGEATLSWSHPETDSTNRIKTYEIERKFIGGDWANVSSVPATTAAYKDTIIQDQIYSYRACSKNSGGTSEWVEAPPIFTVPASPHIQDWRRISETELLLILDNTSKIATGVQLRRIEGDDESTVLFLDGLINEIRFEYVGEGAKFSVRNVCEHDGIELYSEWSDAVAPLPACPPSSPTLDLPIAGSVVNFDTSKVLFKWTHNAQDRSLQRRAQVEIIHDDESYSIETDEPTFVALADEHKWFEVNAAIRWRVRTLGAHSEWGQWSGYSTFNIYEPPRIELVVPQPIGRVPVEVALEYEDRSGDLASCVLSVFEAQSGKLMLTRDMSTEKSTSISSADVPFEKDLEYRFDVSVRSSSTLTASSTASSIVDWFVPQYAGLHIIPDRDRGHTSLRVKVNHSSLGTDFIYGDIWRTVDGVDTLLVSGIHEDEEFVDRFAPLNTSYSYKLVSWSEFDTSRVTYHTGSIKTPYAFLYYGEEGIARGIWDPQQSVTLRRPKRELVRYAGRTSPVLYDGGGIDQTETLSLFLDSDEEAKPFVEAMGFGRCIYKSLTGDVFWCAVDISLTPSLIRNSVYGDVSVSITRVEGEPL